MSLHYCRVVLVEPLYPGNIGAAARTMRNFELDDLVLVAPAADHLDRQACRMATHGEDILRRARVVADLDQAIDDCVLVAGTSAKTGGLFRRQACGTPAQIMPHVAQVLRQDRPAALVFGTEPKGLTNDLVSRCHYLIHIPTGAEYPALNLAQAVAICLYALKVAWLEAVKEGPQPDRADAEPGDVISADAFPAEVAAQEQMFAQLRTALEEIHFLYGDKADALMHAVRHLLGKARLSTMEVKVLLGLARQIRWFVRAHP